MEPRERQAREHVARRLRQRYPDLASEIIEGELEAAFRQYDGAQVRNFLPILVEREVVERQARGEAGSAPVA